MFRDSLRLLANRIPHLERAELARLTRDEVSREHALREAHRLFVEIGATARAEQVAREIGR